MVVITVILERLPIKIEKIPQLSSKLRLETSPYCLSKQTTVSVDLTGRLLDNFTILDGEGCGEDDFLIINDQRNGGSEFFGNL